MAGVTGLTFGLVPILIAGALGWLTLMAVGGAQFATKRWHLFYPVGAGLFTFAVFVMSWAGLPISILAVAVLAAGLLLGLFLLARHRRDQQPPQAARSEAEGSTTAPRPSPVSTLITGTLVVLTAAAFVFSVGRAYSSWDSMAIWSVKGYGIAEAGTILAGSEWGSKGLSYPLNLPLQIGLFRLFTGDWLPHSKLIFPIYYLSLLRGMHTYLRRHTSEVLTGVTLLLVAASPVVFDHATNGYANLPFSVYLVLGFLALVEGGQAGDRFLELTGGLLLGLATWTRPEGIYFVAAGAVALWLAQRFSCQRHPATVGWLLPVVLLALPWQMFTVLGGYQNSSVSWLGSGIKSLTFGLGDAYWILRYFAWQAVQPEYWGIAVPVVALILVLGTLRRQQQIGATQIRVLAIAAAVILSSGAYFYLVGFVENLDYVLSTSVERILMPGMILLFVGLNMRTADPVADAGSSG